MTTCSTRTVDGSAAQAVHRLEPDNISENRTLLPVVTIITAETFLAKMRRLQGVCKVLLLEEAWKAIAKEGMASHVKYLIRPSASTSARRSSSRREVEDIISSPIVKESIINNADCRLTSASTANKFDQIQTLLGLTDKERARVLSSISNDPARRHEVFISLGGVVSRSCYGGLDEEYLASRRSRRRRWRVLWPRSFRTATSRRRSGNGRNAAAGAGKI